MSLQPFLIFLFLFYFEMDAAGALLLLTSSTVSGTVVLLEATGVTAATTSSPVSRLHLLALAPYFLLL